nr:MAG TPA: nucleic-acid-binding protein [Caudoviricetes sp.]
MTPEEQRLKKNQESLESYNWYKAHHVCVRCRNASATDGFATCPKCRETMNENHRIRYAGLTPEEKAERSEKKKAVREARRAAGLCTRCGREREDTNLLTCERCRRGDRERKCKR